MTKSPSKYRCQRKHPPLVVVLVGAVLALLGASFSAPFVGKGQASPLKLVAKIPLPNIEGRIDHLALDSETDRLFVAALGNGTVEMIDLTRNLRVRQIDGLREPQGVLFLSSSGRLFVTNGGNAAMSIFRSRDLAPVGRIELRDDPDNIRFEPASGRVWVGEGVGRQGALAAIAPDSDKIAFEVTLDGHPESFQLEATGPRIFVNVPGAREVEVIDRESRKVVARWKLAYSSNFPMAIDEGHTQILVGCRRPPRMLVLNMDTGHVVADLVVPGDVDDIYIDHGMARVYVSGGEGVVRVFSRRKEGNFAAVGDVPTGAGARTSLFDPKSHRLYVAVPRTGSASAEILVLEAAK